MDNKTIKYIIQFLLGNAYSPEIDTLVSYGYDIVPSSGSKVVIIPSGFFEDCYGTLKSLPTLPLQSIEGIPLLFGSPEIIKESGRIIVKADIIASTYFLISRYEEYVKKGIRDIHGRFPGKESIPYQAGFIHRPIVDEYGQLLRNWLIDAGVILPNIPEKINKIYLTHDIDVPFLHRRFKSFIKGLLISKDKSRIVKSYFGKPEVDSAYTFPWLIEKNKRLIDRLGKQQCESIFFFMAGGSCPEDKPVYNLYSKDSQFMIDLAKRNEVIIGLHASYSAGLNPRLISLEKAKLEKASQLKITINRHHFLAYRNPEDFRYLTDAGITDDFTMGYADVAGFRLGTCRSVRYIDPDKRMLTSLLLHPLTVMDCSLDNPNYMGLDFEDAYRYCLTLTEQTKRFNGELVLLWHNTSVIENPGNWQRKLYQKLLDYLYETSRS